MSVNSSSSIIRFGTFELDLQTGELRHAGRKVKLQEQPFQVLATLLEHPGKIVTREELRSKLWPENTFVDFDHSLNAAIKRLRDALGEPADAPVYIETLARRVYRFIAPVNGSSGLSNVGTKSPSYRRVKLGETHSQLVVDLKDLHQFEFNWAGLTPDGSPLFMRDLNTDEIYSLD